MAVNASVSSTFDEQEMAHFERRTNGWKQSLWRVDDNELYKPGERFLTEESPYIRATIEQGQGPMELAPVPKGLVAFTEDFVKRFGVISTEHCSVRDVVYRMMQFLDYTDPYFLFVNMPVQLVPNQLKFTYRHRSTGHVLDPSRVEIFQVVHGWNFQPYRDSVAVLEHPLTKAVLRGEHVLHPKTGQPLTREEVLDRMAKGLWGPAEHIRAHVEDWLFHHYTDLEDELRAKQDELALDSMEACQRRDSFFWTVATVGCMLWFRSPHALPFLIDYHPIYGTVLYMTEDRQPRLVPYSGGEAVVSEWDVYNHTHLLVEKSAPPGTCECCKTTLHCTKYINATALKFPTCYCGKPVDPQKERYEHDLSYSSVSKTPCSSYFTDHPEFWTFVCIRCMDATMQGRERDPQFRCGRSIKDACPATQCSHHAGQGAYLAALRQRRSLSLQDMRQG